jgi:hypothetical protein
MKRVVDGGIDPRGRAVAAVGLGERAPRVGDGLVAVGVRERLVAAPPEIGRIGKVEALRRLQPLRVPQDQIVILGAVEAVTQDRRSPRGGRAGRETDGWCN